MNILHIGLLFILSQPLLSMENYKFDKIRDINKQIVYNDRILRKIDPHHQAIFDNNVKKLVEVKSLDPHNPHAVLTLLTQYNTQLRAKKYAIRHNSYYLISHNQRNMPLENNVSRLNEELSKHKEILNKLYPQNICRIS